MTFDEARGELSIIMAEAGDLKTAPPFSLRERINALYWAVCRKRVAECNCRNRYADAIVEIYNALKRGKMKTDKAILRGGVIIWWKGTPYSKHNITDKVATEYLSKFPQNTGLFEELPPVKVEQSTETKKTAKKGKKTAKK